jgi:hypothetical protein
MFGSVQQSPQGGSRLAEPRDLREKRGKLVKKIQGVCEHKEDGTQNSLFAIKELAERREGQEVVYDVAHPAIISRSPKSWLRRQQPPLDKYHATLAVVAFIGKELPKRCVLKAPAFLLAVMEPALCR